MYECQGRGEKGRVGKSRVGKGRVGKDHVSGKINAVRPTVVWENVDLGGNDRG